MSTKIVTSIYSDLHGTDLGGRASRGSHYRYSLKTILKMTDADFVCYTSENEIESLKDFFYVQNNIPENKLIFKVFDLRNFSLTEKINKIKNVEEVKASDRCVEIQYSKFLWCLEESKIGNYQNIYWFDAGLSHNGLFPDKYMNSGVGYWETYYETKLINNQLLHNLINFTGDKIVVCAKENLNNYWSGTVPQKYYNNHCMDRHIIGGFFGGKNQNIKSYCGIFFNYLNDLLENETILYFEEHIMSLIYYNHPELFQSKFFDTWWHENSNIPGINMEEYMTTRKSFYKIMEELNA
jgi:hypothetical protein